MREKEKGMRKWNKIEKKAINFSFDLNALRLWCFDTIAADDQRKLVNGLKDVQMHIVISL